MGQVFDWRDAPEGEFAVIGDPVAHSLSPKMHMAAFAALGEPYRYHAIRVVEDEVEPALAYLRTLGYKGVNITIPHKFEVMGSLGSTDEFARRCGAVNTVRLDDLYGINTDGAGFMASLGGKVQPQATVLLLGAGGSARAIALALALDGYNIRVFNRTQERAFSLVRELAIQAEVVDYPALQDVQLIVNATSLSLQNEMLAIPFESAPGNALAYDLVYGETQFLRAAELAGLRIMDGKRMLLEQGALAQEFWLGRTAPRDVMAEAIK